MQRDDADIQAMVGQIKGQYQSPFDLQTVPSELVNIVTGLVASSDVEQSMSGESSINIDSEVLFRRFLADANSRDVKLETVVQHELAAIPPSMFHEDGSMRKTNMADLAKKLESHCEEQQLLPEKSTDGYVYNTAYIVDGMALLQALNVTLFKTFDDLAHVVLKKLNVCHHRYKSVSFVTLVVFDRYDKPISIKSAERSRRTGGDDAPTYVVSGPRVVPNYKRFMSNAANKTSLVEFISTYVAANAPTILPEDTSIVLAGRCIDGRTVQMITNAGVEELPRLFSSQE
jgi:hypothetical protein